jgi:hypothetical protein
MMTILRLLIIVSLAALTAPSAWSHTQSYSFLSLTLGPTSAEGRLELAVRDLDRIHDLDADRNGEITWGEFRRREHELAAATLGRVSIGASDARCSLTAEPAMTDSRGGETYIVIPFLGACPPHAGPVTLGYDLLFTSDAQHRGLVAVTTSQGVRTFVMTPAVASVAIDSVQSAGRAGFLSFVGHGAHHIWIGYDHILFLLTLLIGAFAMRGSERTPRESLYEAIKVVTAFTVAHSLTLGLAAFGVLSLPTALTESLIAITITLAALNNIWPLVSAVVDCRLRIRSRPRPRLRQYVGRVGNAAGKSACGAVRIQPRRRIGAACDPLCGAAGDHTRYAAIGCAPPLLWPLCLAHGEPRHRADRRTVVHRPGAWIGDITILRLPRRLSLYAARLISSAMAR